jgi:hypothetical protein
VDITIETLIVGASSVWLGLLSFALAAWCGWMVFEEKLSGQRLLLTALSAIGYLVAWYLAFHWAAWPLLHAPT